MSEGKKLIKDFEGLKLESYICPAGKWTIGYGHTAGVKPNQTITKEQAEAMFDEDYANFAKEVAKLVTVPIKDNQLGALVSFAYNLGTGALLGSTLLRKLNTGDYIGAAREFDKWVYYKDPKTGTRMVSGGLQRRRSAERDLFEGV